MSTPLVSRPRRVISRTCYYTATLLALTGFAMLFIAFNGNLWVVSLFGALSLLILGNTLGAPKSCVHPLDEERPEKDANARPINADTPCAQHL